MTLKASVGVICITSTHAIGQSKPRGQAQHQWGRHVYSPVGRLASPLAVGGHVDPLTGREELGPVMKSSSLASAHSEPGSVLTLKTVMMVALSFSKAHDLIVWDRWT